MPILSIYVTGHATQSGQSQKLEQKLSSSEAVGGLQPAGVAPMGEGLISELLSFS